MVVGSLFFYSAKEILLLILIPYILGMFVWYSLSKSYYKEEKQEYRLTLGEILLIIFWAPVLLVSFFAALYWKLKGTL